LNKLIHLPYQPSKQAQLPRELPPPQLYGQMHLAYRLILLHNREMKDTKLMVKRARPHHKRTSKTRRGVSACKNGVDSRQGLSPVRVQAVCVKGNLLCCCWVPMFPLPWLEVDGFGGARVEGGGGKSDMMTRHHSCVRPFKF
jgi:hypothetical protein